MVEKLYQEKFTLKNLMFTGFQLPSNEFWLKKDEVLFKPSTGGIDIFILDKRDEIFPDPSSLERKILPYLKICSLITAYAPMLEQKETVILKATKKILKATKVYPHVMREAMSPHFVQFLNDTKSLHEMYSPLIETFAFLDTALRYY